MRYRKNKRRSRGRFKSRSTRRGFSRRRRSSPRRVAGFIGYRM